MISFLSIIMMLVFYFWSIILLLSSWRLYQFWFNIREESLLHLVLIIVYITFFLISISSYYLITLILFGEIGRIPTLLASTISYGFYLEFSLFYLALFNNTRHYFEKYIPILIGFILLFSIVQILLYKNLYSFDLVGITFNIASLIILLYLFVQLYRKIGTSKKFFDQKEKDFIILLEKMIIFAFVLFILIGLSHILINLVPIYFDEVYIITTIISVNILGLIFLYCKKIISKYARSVDWLIFYNNVS